MNKSLIPVSLPKRTPLQSGAFILAADAGGTKTDLALFEVRADGLSVVREEVFPSAKFKAIEDIITTFQGNHAPPDRISIAFAGPVQHGKAQATNLGWRHIDAARLSRTLGVEHFFLLNDLEAGAYGLAALQQHDLLSIYKPSEPGTGGNVGIIAPGTGLGEAGLYWDGRALHPFATEGGHSDFAVRNETDWEFFSFLKQKFGHVSWERVLSGPGIYNIYCFLRDVKKGEEPAWLNEKIHSGDPGAAIAHAAKEGLPLCQETLRMFVQYLAIEASSMALKYKATGGIFIGGGITPKIWTSELQETFTTYFFQVGRMRPLLESMPVHLILNPKTALLGAAYYGIF